MSDNIISSFFYSYVITCSHGSKVPSVKDREKTPNHSLGPTDITLVFLTFHLVTALDSTLLVWVTLYPGNAYKFMFKAAHYLQTLADSQLTSWLANTTFWHGAVSRQCPPLPCQCLGQQRSLPPCPCICQLLPSSFRRLVMWFSYKSTSQTALTLAGFTETNPSRFKSRRRNADADVDK